MKRAIGIVRVSRLGEDAASPDIQDERISAACRDQGLDLLTTYRELDVSGGTPLEQRHGLRVAVEAIERGEADVLMVAYFDRLVRSLKVQQEVIDRVEAAGGEVLTLDFGKLTNGSAVQRLTGNFIGAVAQFVREQSAEKSAAAVERAVARGVPIGPVPPGYLRSPDKTYRVDPDVAPVVRELFERRAAGESSAELRGFLAEHGIARTVSGVRKMLHSRLYLGEIHYGKWANLEAHEPLIGRDLFGQVQRMTASAGRKAKSVRLLARIGVLRCGSCDGRMSVDSNRRGEDRFEFYRCKSQDCARPMTIGAALAEAAVLDALAGALADTSATASAAAGADDAQAALDTAQAALDAAVRGFTAAGVLAEASAVEHLGDLRAARDAAQRRRAELGRAPAGRIYAGTEIVERGSVEARRELLLALGCRVVVAPGRGAGRLAIEFKQALGLPV